MQAIVNVLNKVTWQAYYDELKNQQCRPELDSLCSLKITEVVLQNIF